MAELIVRRRGPLSGNIRVPGDKSITHRAIVLGALADGDTLVRGWVAADVCQATLRNMRALGVEIETHTDADGTPLLVIHGRGFHGLREAADIMDCAGSGTTMRLLAGLLAGQPFYSVLTGSDALRHRPMGRVVDPLCKMGATILGRDGSRLAPLTIRGGGLRAIDYTMPVASAQVKSAILLAALCADGETMVREPGPSRDHTERMLRAFGVDVITEGLTVRLAGGQRLAHVSDAPLAIPGDFSSAAFPLIAALLVPSSRVHLQQVGLNPTRTGLLDLLRAMGAGASLSSSELGPAGTTQGEPCGDILACQSGLHGTEAFGDVIVRAIDEFPVFAVAATQAEGITLVRQAEELRVKESDRIAAVARELRKLGGDVEELPDGMVIRGPTRLRGAILECHRDHRLAMAMAVAGLVAEGETRILGAEAINDSFPSFVEAMQALGADIHWRCEV